MRIADWIVDCGFADWIVDCGFADSIVDCGFADWIVDCGFADWIVDCGLVTTAMATAAMVQLSRVLVCMWQFMRIRPDPTLKNLTWFRSGANVCGRIACNVDWRVDCWAAGVDKREFQRRTKRFGLEVIAFIRTLPTDAVSAQLARQLVKSCTGVGANYRHACRAKSKADFISKMGNVEEEADESLYWLEVLVEGHVAAAKAVEPLLDEGQQLLRMVVASINTARGDSR